MAKYSFEIKKKIVSVDYTINQKYFYSMASIFSYVIIFIDYTTLRAASWPI